MTSASELVMLRGGLAVSLSALRKLWELEVRGLDLRLDGKDILVRPRGVLSDEDRAEISRLKPDLIALIAYCGAPEAHQ